VKLLFAMLNPGYVRNYESTLRLLAAKGHTARLLFVDSKKEAGDRLAERLAAECPSVSLGVAPRRDDVWAVFARAVRGSMDYLRYLHPRYAGADRLRARARGWRLGPALRPVDSLLPRTAAGVRLTTRFLGALERAIPSSRKVEGLLRRWRPDVVLVTPLVDLGSDQVDYVKSARALGIPVGLCVASWDNLTNKGLIRVEPDVVIVWNEIQSWEAVELHGIPPSKVVVTGAQRFDEWFDRRPRTTRGAFCARLGLDPTRPFLLYVCSSPFIAPKEVPFVEEWARRLRDAGEGSLRDVGIVVRPHPQNADQWRGVDLGRFGNVAIWPLGGANPVDPASKTDYYDSLYHSAAVVGINTSALIEAGIVGRPVHTLLAPEFAGSQHGTLHFRYLAEEHGGLLRVAETFEEHLAQLAESLAGCGADGARNRCFVESFVRPHGLAVAATPIVVEAIEALARSRPPAARPPAWAYPLRLTLLPLALLSRAFWLARTTLASR
jgi:hypothetical protein